MANRDVVVRDNKNMLCQFFIGISSEYENEITMNIAEIQKIVENINMQDIDASKDYEKHFKDLGYSIDNGLYTDLLKNL